MEKEEKESKILGAEWDISTEETNRRLADILYHIKNKQLYKEQTLLFTIAHIAAFGAPF